MNQNEQMRELIEAALNMVDVKGRHHSEIAMTRLIKAAKQYREQSVFHVNETPKNEHDNGDVLKKGGNLDMMREALKAIANMPEHDQDDAHRLRYMARQTLAAEPDHIPDDTKMVQSTPLVRLTDQDISNVISEQYGKSVEGNNILPYTFANAIMDALIKKNGGEA